MGAKKSRLAFGSKSDAIAFQKEHGGTVGNFTDALNVD
jgi:nitrous oxide reductase accessory protein NosL